MTRFVCGITVLLVAELTAAPSARPIDSILERYWTANQLQIPAPVADNLFARRAYFDLWGLPPTPEQLQVFERDLGRDKRERLIDELLANRQNYAEHWISYWNDLLRNDEGVVYEGARESITHWLLPALKTNLPYDQFVAKLLNPAATGDPKGFLIGVNWRGDVSASQIPPMQAAQNSAQVFLGVNLKCNSCHDSFISSWKLKDAYGLASFFSEKPLDIYRCDVKTGEQSAAKFLYPNLGGVDPNASLSERRTEAARMFTCKQNVRFARTFVNRIWDRLLGHGLVRSVDDMDGKAWSPELLDALAADFADHGYDMQFLLKRILLSRAYQAPAVLEPERPKAFVFRGPVLRRLTAEQYADAISSITGEWPVLAPDQSGAGVYSREWRLKSSPLTRSLGRPIRDQVYTTRNQEATTLQALELVNGEKLDSLLSRGAKRMLDKLPEPPPNLFDSGIVESEAVDVDIDINGISKLWLLTEDTDSYDPSRIIAGWANAEFTRANGEKAPLAAAVSDLHFRGHAQAKAFITGVSSEHIFDVAGKGYTQFHATVGVDDKCLINEIGPRVRFFVFGQKPDYAQLSRVTPGTPVPRQQQNYTAESLVTRLYVYALSREPLPAERRAALDFLNVPPGSKEIASTALQDLLWALFQSPEFQFIR